MFGDESPFSDFFETHLRRRRVAARPAARAPPGAGAATTRRRRTSSTRSKSAWPTPTGARRVSWRSSARTARPGASRSRSRPASDRLARPGRRPGRPGQRRRSGRRHLPRRHGRRRSALRAARRRPAHEVRAPFTTLLLGGEARVPTPDGRTLALTIPAGTQDGRSLPAARPGHAAPRQPPTKRRPPRRGPRRAAERAVARASASCSRSSGAAGRRDTDGSRHAMTEPMPRPTSRSPELETARRRSHAAAGARPPLRPRSACSRPRASRAGGVSSAKPSWPAARRSAASRDDLGLERAGVEVALRLLDEIDRLRAARR